MSSTNRGKDRSKQDYYVTPVHQILDFFRAITRDLSWSWAGKEVLDPCAGGDARHTMSYPVALEQFCREQMAETRGPNTLKGLTTVDIRKDSLAHRIGDYLIRPLDSPVPDVVMSNPPFFLAQQFIDKALDDVVDKGWVIMLLRLNYFGSGKRRKWWQERMPVWTYVHSERMGFTDDGKTDSIEYCHCMWQKNNYPKATQLIVI